MTAKSGRRKMAEKLRKYFMKEKCKKKLKEKQ